MKHWRKMILPFWTMWSVILLTAAVPLQSTLEEIPWWVWLVVIAVLILVMFGLVLMVDVRSAGNNENDKNE